MGKRIEIPKGTRFGRLTVTGKTVPDKARRLLRECVCDCGKTVYVTAANLKRGFVRSCGCLRREMDDQRIERRFAERRVSRPLPEVTPEWAERQARRNREAGMAFDDLWMFGDCHAVARLRRLFK